MKFRLVLLLVIAGYFTGKAQIGFSAQYNNIEHTIWTDIFESSNIYDFEEGYTLPNTTGFGVDYWLHPFQYRIEFFPTLAYSKHSDTQPSIINSMLNIPDTKFDLSMIEFSIPTRVYPLDIEGECDCPTWGKDGSLIKKGFFLAGIIGLSQVNLETQYSELVGTERVETLITERKKIIPHIGIGTGLDIGINKYITVTPFVNYKVHLNADGENLQNTVSANGVFFEETDSNINQLQVGIRLGFQFKD